MAISFDPNQKRLQQIYYQCYSCSVSGSGLCILGCCLLFAPLLGSAVEASIQEALSILMLEVLPSAHHGGVVDQGVEQLPVPAGPLGTGHLVLFLLLLDQLDPCRQSRFMIMQTVQSQRK